MVKRLVTLSVNGEVHQVAFEPYKTLLEVLREDLDLTGTKHGCELGECGACTVLVDELPIMSCIFLAVEAVGTRVTTIEGLAEAGEPSALQRAFAHTGGAQCGYCTPGMIMSGTALLRRNTTPTRDEIREALAGNLCRCTGYVKIFDAVELAAHELAGRGVLNGGSSKPEAARPTSGEREPDRQAG
jgi:carbon-monoxide dehydrogenase small subunit